MKIGVYVGSFNPVHKGHINVVNYLLQKNYVDKVIIIPTKEYWDKTNLVSLQDRINMLKNYETDKIIIDTKHNEYKYTYEILRDLKREYKAELYLIIGSDNLERLDEWKNIDEIKQNKIIVLKRGKNSIKDLDNKIFIVINQWNNINASSTEVRNGNTNLLDEPVFKYIKRKKLYDI